jgi:Tfp pilus assembly protein PilF
MLARFAAAHGLFVGALAACVWLGAGCTGRSEQSAHDKAELHYKLANSAFYEKNPLEAIQELYLTIELEPNHKEAHHLIGFIYFGRQEYAEAEIHLRRALEIDPKFFEARGNLGALFLAQERWQEAVEALSPLLAERLYPTPHLLHNNLGWALYNLGDYEKAEEHYKLAVFLKPQMCLAHNNLGLLYLQTARPDVAVAAFDRAISKCTDYQEPYLHLGNLYVEAGQLELAAKAFEKCYAIGAETPLGLQCQAQRNLLGGVQ